MDNFEYTDVPVREKGPAQPSKFPEKPTPPLSKGNALIQVRLILGSHGFVRVTPEGEKQAGNFQNGFECLAYGHTWEEVLENLRSRPAAEEAVEV